MILIKNGKIFTMVGNSFEKGFILVIAKKIAYVGESYTEALAIYDKNKSISDESLLEIDVEGSYVLPGLIDAHCHVGMLEDSIGFEGDDGNEASDPVTPHLRAIDGIYYLDRAFQEAREAGVTTVVTGPGSANVIGGQFVAMKTFGRKIEDMILKEPVAMKIAFGENPKTVYNEKKQAPMTRMATAAILRESLFKAKEYMEQWKEYEEDTEENDKPEFDMRYEALVKVLKKEIPLKAHAHRADDILTALRVAKEFDVNITIDHCTEGYLITDLLVEEDATVIVGPLITDRSKYELKNQSAINPKILDEAGLKPAITTDHPCVPIQYLALSAALAVKEGMREESALAAITSYAAQVAGIWDRVGSLEVGKDADIAIFQGHPLDIRSHVCYTIINGKIVYTK